MITIKPLTERIKIWLEKEMDNYKGDVEGMCVVGNISHRFKKEFIMERNEFNRDKK